MPVQATSVRKSSVYTTRHSRLADALKNDGIDALILNPSPSLTYLTGIHFHLMERPIALIFAPGLAPAVILPELETAKLTGLPFQVQSFPFNDIPTTWPDAYLRAVQVLKLDGCRIGVEPTRFRVLELRYLESAAPHAQIVSAESAVASLRMRKDAGEIAAMRKAAEIAQNALQATIPHIHIGMAEQEIASEMVQQLHNAGTNAEVPFTPIVSGGPNSANPHAFPSSRKINPGDLLVIDWGASYEGYVSDITRTFAIGEITPELHKVYDTVKQANEAGREISRPGIPASDVDRAAREVIEAAGYGKYFTHRVGHGLGMEGHEEPYMHSANQLLLAPGMTYTVEPGIYLTDYNGVRIEDDVVVTEDGAKSLTDFTRELTTIGR
jgi:Xaa-Pro dipeptidase